MGLATPQYPARGTFYVDTFEKPPYCSKYITFIYDNVKTNESS